MSNKSRVIISISVVLNVLFIIALIVILNNQSNTVPDSIAEEVVSAPATIIPPTQTPFVITVVATLAEFSPELILEPTQTAVPIATSFPPTQIPTTTPLPSPTPTSTPIPVVAEAVYTGPDWLRYVNQFRNQADVPFLVEDTNMSDGANGHSYYMVLNNSVSHSEDASTPGFTEAGHRAGQNGNIAISGVAGVFYDWPIDYWISAPFHAVPLFDPTLGFTGYGEYTDANSNFGMAATIDIKSGLNEDATFDQYPIMFPRDGGEAWVRVYHMPEFPDASTGCAGYQKPLGAPILLLLGDGGNTPQIYETRLSDGDIAVEHCSFDETNYYNPEGFWQQTGRTILDGRDAVIIIPRSPLEVGHQYTAYVNNGGEEMEWSFTVVPHPLKVIEAAAE